MLFEIINDSFIDMIKALFIVGAFGFGHHLSSKNWNKWKQYLLGICIVGLLSIGMLTNIGGGKIIDGPDLFAPGGVRDTSDVLPGYPSKKDKIELVLRIFFTYAPPTVLGVFIGNRNKRVAT